MAADPGRVKAYFRRALAREQLGEDGDALRDAKRVLEVGGLYPPAHCVSSPTLGLPDEPQLFAALIIGVRYCTHSWLVVTTWLQNRFAGVAFLHAPGSCIKLLP